MADFDPQTAVPDEPALDFDPSTAQPYEPRSAGGEVVTAAKRGLFEGIRGAGAVLQTPAERAKEEPGPISKLGKTIETFGKEHAANNPAQPDDHNPVTNFLAQAAEAPGAALPIMAGAIPGAAAGGVVGPIGAAIGGAVGGGGAAALQTWHEKYQEGLAKKLPDEQARAYADESAVASGVGMGALSALPGAGSLAGKAIGMGAKTALEAGADVAGKKLLPEFGKSAAGMAVGNTALGMAGAAEQANIDTKAGLEAPSPWEAASAAAFPSLAGAAGFLPLSALHAVRTVGESRKISDALANPDAHPLARTRAAGAVFEGMEKVDPEAAQMWAINAKEAIKAGKPVGMDSSWADGPHPSVFPEIKPPAEDPTGALENEGGGQQQATQPVMGELPSPRQMPIQPGEGPFDLSMQHNDNAAADHAAAIEAARAQEEARLQQFASHGPLSAAAVAGVRSGAVEAAGQQRLTEIPASKTEGKPAEGLHENITAFARNAEALPLHEAQARAAAIDTEGHDYTVVPHPGSDGGYTIVPSRLLTPKIIKQYAGLQSESAQLPAERMMPFSSPEAAKARADALTNSTGRQHEIIPHPLVRDRFAVREKPIDASGADNAATTQRAADGDSANANRSGDLVPGKTAGAKGDSPVQVPVQSSSPGLGGASAPSGDAASSKNPEKATTANPKSVPDLLGGKAAAVERDSSINVESGSSSAGPHGHAVPRKNSLDGGLLAPNLARDLAETHPALVHGFDSLEVDGKRAVVHAVRSAIGDDKVFDAVVKAIPVDVVNDLLGRERSTEVTLHDKAMLQDRLAADPNSTVTAKFVDAIRRVGVDAHGAHDTANEAKTQGGKNALEESKPSRVGTQSGGREGAGRTSEGEGVGHGDNEGIASGQNAEGKASREAEGNGARLHKDEISAAAHEAATSPTNERAHPTAAQSAEGNYKKGHVKIHGLDISIENPAGSVRVDKEGKWAQSMANHYGYIRRSEGNDGDHVDAFIGDKPQSTKVFIVDQVDPKTGKFDEHKTFIGFDSAAEAKAAYHANYPADFKGFKSISETTIDGLKQWLKSGNTKIPYADQPRMMKHFDEPHQIDLRAGSETHADVTPEIAKLFGGTPKELAGEAIRQVPPEGQKIISAAVKNITDGLGLPGSFLDGLSSFHTYDNGGDGQYFPGAKSIGVKAGVLAAVNGGDRAWTQALRGMLVHELMHHIDYDGEGRFSSSRSAAFDISTKGNSRFPEGGIIREALRAYAAGPTVLKTFFRYPLAMWGDKPGDHFHTDILKEEIFAQIGRLYYTNPGLLLAHLPLAHGLFEEIHNATVQADSIDAARRAVQQTVRALGADGSPPKRYAGPGTRSNVAQGDRVKNTGSGMGKYADNEHPIQRPDIAGERSIAGSEVAGEAGRLSERPSETIGTGDKVGPEALSINERASGDFSSVDAATLLAGNPRAAAYTPFGAKVKEHVEDFLTTQKTYNWLNQTINTQMHKAEKNDAAKRWFKPVYDKVQDFLNTANRSMMDAAELAPDVLPQLDSVRDLLPKFLGGRGLSKDDLKKVSDAVFSGTLADKIYTADELKAQGLSDHQAELYRQSRAAIDKSLTDTFMSEAARQSKDLLPKSMIDAAVEAGDPWKIVEALADRGPEAKEVYDLLRERAAKIEDLKRQGYAPLMRFGRYTVDGRDASGERTFTMHESERDANAMARALRANGMTVEQGIMSQEKWKLFQGVSPDTLELFGEAVGASDKQMFQEYLARAVNNRSVLKRLMQRKGIAGFENDVQRTLAQFITSNGRAAARNYHWNDVSRLANEIPKEHGDIADEAVKLKDYVENPGADAGAVRGALFIQFLGGSVASGIVNATQPVLMTFPYLAQFGGARKAASALLGAGKIAAGVKPTEPGLAAAMARATKEGIIAPHEVAGLYAEAIRNFGSNLGVRKALKAWGSIFAITEAFNRRITFVAAYRMGVAKGEANPFAFAERAVQQTQGVYNKGNRPNIARGPVGATLFTFKQYSVAYVELLKRLPAPQRALALATLVVASGVQGVPFAQDIENVIDTIAQALGYNFNSAQKLRQWAAKTLGESAGGFLYQGTSNIPGAPIDVSARLGVGNLIPGSGILKRSETDKTRDVLQWFGPAGSQAAALMQAFSAAQEGRYDRVARVGLPVAVQNAIQGAQMAESGYYRDMKGRRVVDTTAGDAIFKAIGFQPAKVANESEIVFQAEQGIQLQKDIQTNVISRWAQGIVEHDPEMVQAARAALVAWNMKNPSSRVIVTPQAVQHQVQAALATRQQRFIKAAPKQDRGDIGKELRGQ